MEHNSIVYAFFKNNGWKWYPYFSTVGWFFFLVSTGGWTTKFADKLYPRVPGLHFLSILQFLSSHIGTVFTGCNPESKVYCFPRTLRFDVTAHWGLSVVFLSSTLPADHTLVPRFFLYYWGNIIMEIERLPWGFFFAVYVFAPFSLDLPQCQVAKSFHELSSTYHCLSLF